MHTAVWWKSKYRFNFGATWEQRIAYRQRINTHPLQKRHIFVPPQNALKAKIPRTDSRSRPSPSTNASSEDGFPTPSKKRPKLSRDFITLELRLFWYALALPYFIAASIQLPIPIWNLSKLFKAPPDGIATSLVHFLLFSIPGMLRPTKWDFA